MNSNFERLQKIINQAYDENFNCLFDENPEICQDVPNQGQDDLVLYLRKKNISDPTPYLTYADI